MEISFEEDFNEENIEEIRGELREYLYELSIQPLYLQNCEEKAKLYNDILFDKDSEIRYMLDTYEYLLYKESTMEIWLAYQVGYKARFKTKEER